MGRLLYLYQKQSNGTNAVSLYFILTAIALWILTISTQGFHLPHVQGINGYIFVLINAVFLYGLSSLEYWYYQREHARFNYAFLFFSNFLIGILSFCFELQFNNQFWYGALTVTLGSLICWYSIRKTMFNITKRN